MNFPDAPKGYVLVQAYEALQQENAPLPDGVTHALCNAHPLRELQALVEIEQEDWAAQMQRILLLCAASSQRQENKDGIASKH